MEEDGQCKIQVGDSDLNTQMNASSDGSYFYTFYMENGEGEPALDITIALRQPVLCLYYDNSNISSSYHFNGNCTTIDMNYAAGVPAFQYGDSISTLQPVYQNFSVKYNTTLMTNESGTYTFILKCDDSWKINMYQIENNCGQQVGQSTSYENISSIERGEVTIQFDKYLSANTYYSTLIEYEKYIGNSILQLYWIKPGQINEEIIPTENLWFDYCFGGERIELDLICPIGYSAGFVQDELFCHETCGDGLRLEAEQWDDSNKNSSDGCSSTCTVETGYICTGGNAEVSDKWVKCPVGYKHHRYFDNSDYVECIPQEDSYEIIFYFMIVFLGFGMIKYFVKDFVRVYQQDKSNIAQTQNENEFEVQENMAEGGSQTRENDEDTNHISFHS